MPIDGTNRCANCGSELRPMPGGGYVCARCALTSALDPTPIDESLPLDRMGDFQPIRELGSGGMGRVIEAHQLSLDRRVALKVLHPSLGLSRVAIERFEREARSAARLHHTNIVPVYSIHEANGSHFYAMELIDGESLAELLTRIRKGRPGDWPKQSLAEAAEASTIGESRDAPAAHSSTGASTLPGTDVGARAWYQTIARLVADVADALDYAHKNGIIHRDIKPANLMLSKDGRLCVTDFGLARALEDHSLTITGALMGSPQYMSPEQVTAGRVSLDHRTDIYSLGVVLYELITLRHPVSNGSREQVLSDIVFKDPKAPRRVEARIPVDLETICLKAMEKRPDQRYASAGELAKDLRQFVGGGLIGARRSSLFKRARKWAKRHPLALLSSASLVATISLALLAWSQSAASSREAMGRAIEMARYALSTGEYRLGVAALEPFMSKQVVPAQARVLMARLLVRQGRATEARAQAERALTKSPDDWVAHLVLLETASFDPRMGLGSPSLDIDEHVHAVERATAGSAESLYLRALLAETDQRAIELLTQALDVSPGYADAINERAERFLRLADLQQARVDAERLTAVRPRSAEGWRLMARVHDAAHEEGAAFDALERALRVDPNDPFSHVDRAWLQYDRGDYQRCESDGDQAIRLAPTLADAYWVRAFCDWNRGKTAETATYLKRAIDVNPEFTNAYQSLALLAENTHATNDVQRLVQALRARVSPKSDPETLSRILLIEAWSLAAQDQHERALLKTDEALQMTPTGSAGLWALQSRIEMLAALQRDTSPACQRLAELEVQSIADKLLQLNSIASACSAEQLIDKATRVIEARPQLSDAYALRSMGFRWTDRLAQAALDLDRAIQLTPQYSELYEERARVYLAMGRTAEAVIDAERAGDDPSARYVLIDALAQAGRLQTALERLDALASIESETLPALQRKAELLGRAGKIVEAIGVAEHSVQLAAQQNPPSRKRESAVLLASLKAAGGDCEPAGQLVSETRTQMDHNQSFRSPGVSRWLSVLVASSCPSAADPELAARLMPPGAPHRPIQKRFNRTVEDGYSQTLALTEYRLGRYAEAERLLSRAIATEVPDQPVSVLFHAMALGKLGKTKEARRELDRAVGLAGVYPPLGFARLAAEARQATKISN